MTLITTTHCLPEICFADVALCTLLSPSLTYSLQLADTCVAECIITNILHHQCTIPMASVMAVCHSLSPLTYTDTVPETCVAWVALCHCSHHYTLLTRNMFGWCCTVLPTLTYSLHMADTCVAEVDLHTASTLHWMDHLIITSTSSTTSTACMHAPFPA